jgi:hypothetical protein
MAHFAASPKRPKTPTAPRPDNFRRYLNVRRSRFVPREVLCDGTNGPSDRSPETPDKLRLETARTPRTRSPAIMTPASAPSKSDVKRRVSFGDCSTGSPVVLQGSPATAASIESYVPAFETFGVPLQQLFVGGLPATPSPVRAPALQRSARKAPAQPCVKLADMAPLQAIHTSSPVTRDPPRPKVVAPAKRGASSLFARLAKNDQSPKDEHKPRGARKKALLGGAQFAAGAVPSKMRGVVSATLRCIKCAHEVARFPGRRWKETAAYMHFREYHPDPARLLAEAAVDAGCAAYCCQCTWMDCVELRELGCDHAWAGY